MRIPFKSGAAFLAFALAPFTLHAQTAPPVSSFFLGFDGLFLAQQSPDWPSSHSFGLQEAHLSLSGTVDPTWNLFGDLVFQDDSVEAEELFATTTAIPNVFIRVGKIYLSFGKHATLRAYAYPFIPEPMVVENTLGDDGLRDDGLEATWTPPSLPWDLELTLGAYQAIGTGAGLPLDLGSASSDNIPYLAHLKNVFSLDDNTTLEAGASALAGMGTDSLHHGVVGADLTLKSLPAGRVDGTGFILQGEYQDRFAYDQNGNVSPGADGWYASFQYRWSPEWWSGLRAEEAFNSTTGDLEGDGASGLLSGHLQRGCLDVAWVPSESSFIRAEYDLTREDNATGTLWDHRILLQLNYSLGFRTKKAN